MRTHILVLVMAACAAPSRHLTLPEDPAAPTVTQAAETGANAAPSCGTPVQCGPLAAFGEAWQSADWAAATGGVTPELIQIDGEAALRFDVKMNGEAYSQGVVNQLLSASFAGCGALAIQVGLPAGAPTSLTAKVILFLDDKWVEPDTSTPLVAGQFVDVVTPLAGASASLPLRADYAKATGFAVKIEGHGTTYNDKIYVAKVGLRSVAGYESAPPRSVGTFGGFLRSGGPEIPGSNGFLTFKADKAVGEHALVWPKLGPSGGDLTLAKVLFHDRYDSLSHADGGEWRFSDWVTMKARGTVTTPFATNTVDAILSRAFPAVRYASPTSAFSLRTAYDGRDRMNQVMWVSNGEIQTSTADADLTTMSEPWLVVSAAGAAGWTFEAPILITLQTRPDALKFNSDGIEVHFADQVGRINVMPLFGVLRDATDDVVVHARAWVARLAAFPVSLAETFEVGASSVAITDTYTFEEIADSWGTVAEHIAPLPPLVVQAQDRGYPVTADFERSGVRTWYGPFAFVRGDSATYTLPLPNGLDRLELPVRVLNDPAVADIRAEHDRLVRDSVQGPADAFLDGDDRGAQFLCEGLATNLEGSAELAKAASHAPKLIEHGWLDSSLQWLTEPVTSQRYINNAKYWASGEPFDKEWYTGRQLAALGACAEITDLAVARAVWPKALGMYRYDRIFWDWALGSALSSVFGYTALIDGIFFAWDGMQAVARLAKKLGDQETYRDAAYRSARQQVAVFMLWHQAKWAQSIDYGVGHISGKKLAAADVETRFAFDGYVEDYGGATLELQSLWQNVNAMAFDVLPQFMLYRDFGIMAALSTLMRDVTPAKHPNMFDGNAKDTVDDRFYGALNTAFYMTGRAAALHDDATASWNVYKNSANTEASKQWYSMRWHGVAGPMMLALERAKAPTVEFPIAGARPTRITYDAASKAVSVAYVGTAQAHSTLKIVPPDGSAPIERAIDTCPGTAGSVTLSLP